MPAVIRRLVTRPERLRRDEAAAFRQAVLPFIDDPGSSPQMVRAARELLGEIDRRSAGSKRWEFALISPVQFGAVVRHLRLESVRPAVACDLWAMCFRFLVPETGEVLLDRSQFLSELGISSRELSRLLSELVKFEAMRRERVPGSREYRYFVNPNAGSRNTAPAIREAEQAKWPALELVGGASRPGERRSRAVLFRPSL